MSKYQELFNRAYLGLKSQDFKLSRDCNAWDPLYRGPDGTRCAIGWLIPDEKYELSFESSPIDRNFRIFNCLNLKNTKENIEFVQKLQNCHDEASDSEDMIMKLENFGKSYGLTIPSD